MIDEITPFLIGYIIGAIFTFIICYSYHFITLRHLVTIKIKHCKLDVNEDKAVEFLEGFIEE